MAAHAHRDEAASVLARLGAFPRRMTSDSRQVQPGVAFAAYPGVANDGRAFIPEAVARGGSAVLWETHGFQWDARWSVPNVAVDNLKHKVSGIADFVYGSPSRALWMVGVTGTNGKTSCAHWIAEALDGCQRRAAIVGTLGNGLVGALAPAVNTTPDACSLQELLKQFVAAGARAVAMEVSSHGLEQGRANGVKFDVALFTNLTRDHLDYHATMAAYGAAKARLFAWPGLSAVVINADDAFGRSLIDQARSRGQRVVTYGFANADVSLAELAMSTEGTTLSVATPRGRGDLATQLVGSFNVRNLLGVLAVLLASDVPLDNALHALGDVSAPPGRMQRLGGGAQPLIVIDYAHTPDALEQVLAAMKPAVAKNGILTCVFGCGGDRDPGKRPEMGRIAASIADRVVVTTDNPRSETPSDIASAVVHGIRETHNRHWVIELDRAAAIRNAIEGAGPGDVVVLAGKGHETYQEMQGTRIPFSDLVHAQAALHARMNSAQLAPHEDVA